MVAMVGDSYDREELAAALWSTYPLGADEALRAPSEHFPDGALLGRFRLDPLDPQRVDGEAVDVLAGAGPGYDPIHQALLERAGRSLLVTDAELDELFTLIETHWCGPWDAPWQLIGLLPPTSGEAPDVMAPTFQAVQLVTVGSGHPGTGLQGLIAPPPVFGLWLVFEGFDRDDDGNRIGEHRMHLVVLADGRWGIRKVRRVDSPYHPRPDSTLGGERVDERVRAGRDDAPFTTSSTDAIGGTVPETLARVLQVSLEPAIEPHEGLLRLLARISVDTARQGVTSIAGVDPTTLAAVMASAHAAGDDALTVDQLDVLVDEIASRAAQDGDWLDDALLLRVERSDALHTAAGVYRALARIDDTTAGWLGSALLAARAAEEAGPVAESLRRLARREPALAERLLRVIDHRRDVWNIRANDDAAIAVRMTLAGAVGRNEPCPCGSGRKAKHCCLR
jgi:hypothetical protein